MSDCKTLLKNTHATQLCPLHFTVLVCSATRVRISIFISSQIKEIVQSWNLQLKMILTRADKLENND